MDTKTMSIFLKIADYQSITRVAEEYQMTQPAVSSALKRLEDEMGCPLFSRKNKSLILNEQGRVLYDHVSGIMQDYYHVKNSLSRGNPGRREIVLKLRATSDKIYALMDEYLQEHPDVSFILRDYSDVDNGTDEGFGLTLKLRQFVSNETYIPVDVQNMIYVIMNKSHPLSRKEQIHFSEIRNEEFVFQRTDSKTGYEPSYVQCVISGVIPRVTLTVDSKYTKYAAIRRGEWIGLAFNNELSFARHVKELAVIPMHEALNGKLVCLAYKDDRISEAEREFARFVQERI